MGNIYPEGLTFNAVTKVFIPQSIFKMYTKNPSNPSENKALDLECLKRDEPLFRARYLLEERGALPMDPPQTDIKALDKETQERDKENQERYKKSLIPIENKANHFLDLTEKVLANATENDKKILNEITAAINAQPKNDNTRLNSWKLPRNTQKNNTYQSPLVQPSADDATHAYNRSLLCTYFKQNMKTEHAIRAQWIAELQPLATLKIDID